MLHGYNREKGKTGRTREEERGGGGGGGGGGMESESVGRERRMESARGPRAFDQRQSARAHATVSVLFVFFLC